MSRQVARPITSSCPLPKNPDRGKTGSSWYVDEIYIKVRGRWCYLYRAIDRDGNLVDSLLSETRGSLRRIAETGWRQMAIRQRSPAWRGFDANRPMRP